MTVLDLVIFMLQAYFTNWTLSTPQKTLMDVELCISTLFLFELCLRCYASEKEELLCASNVIDALVVIVAFSLSLVEISTPVLAARSARLIRLARASSRCSRNARVSTRSAVEMRNFFSDARRSADARARRLNRAKEDDVAPLFLDLGNAPELSAVFDERPWTESRQQRTKSRAENSSMLAASENPLLNASKSLPRSAKAEIEKADALELKARVKPKNKRQRVSPHKADDLAPLVDSDNDDPKRTNQSSVKAIVAIFQHAIARADANDHPPPRIIDLLQHSRLLFLNRDI